MKILSIVWFKVLPAKFGGQKGITHFNRHLAKQLPLVCLCSSDNQKADDLPFKAIPELPPGKKQLLSPSAWNKIRDVAVKEKVSHIILEHPYHGVAAVKAARAAGAKLIVHSHNIESLRFKETGKWWWRILAEYEKWVHRKADLSLFKTTEDKNYAVDHFRLPENKCLIVPFGVEKPVKNAGAAALIRNRHSIPDRHKLLLFAGTLDYRPNADAVTFIYQQLAPALSAKQFACKIIICGRNEKASFRYLRQFSHPDIIMAGEVNDIENYFDAANAFINPVRSGGGIQTKNIDAMAASLNVVCYNDRLNGIPAQQCGNKLFAVKSYNTEEFITAIIHACQQGFETPPAFFDHFNWENITKKVADRINRL